MKKIVSAILLTLMILQGIGFNYTAVYGNDRYVLFEENFDGLSDGSIPQGWISKEGTKLSTVGVKNGAFEIDARANTDNPTRILLPEYLGKFGNYMIEADITNLASNDKEVWNSLMFRIQNNDYPYYQMKVRKNTSESNGVEFAERNSLNACNVIKRTFFYEDLSGVKAYHYTVKAYDNKIQGWINNVPLIDIDTDGSYSTGGIGFQANGSAIRIDNIKITLLETPLTTLTKPEDSYTRVREAETKIVMAPSIITEIKNKKELRELISNGQAATAILTINKNLEVLANGTDYVFGTVSSMYELMKSKVIPAFRVSDSDSAKAISDYLKSNSIEDVFVISKKPELVKQARENYAFIRGIVEFDNVPSDTDINGLMLIRNITNSNISKIAVIPTEAATKSNIQYLQQRLITVWTKETIKNSDSEQKLITFHEMITAGSNGIVTNAPEKAMQALSIYNHDTTIVRTPFLIGHRGVPDLAPENTIEGSELAFKLGADMVENDIQLTKVGADGKQHLVIMHDDTIDRTTNGTGEIEGKTLEEIETYFVNKQFPNEYPSARIPTLDQYFQKFTGRDQVIFVEVKSDDPVTIDRYTELTKTMGADEHLVTISFKRDQLKRTKDQMPEMSIGYLCYGAANGDIYGSLRNDLWQVQKTNSSLMANYYGIDSKFLEASKHRGMNIWLWTFSDKASIKKYFKMGVCGMTTNCAQVFSDWAVDITTNQSRISMKKGEEKLLRANIKTYKGEAKEVVPDVVVLSGNNNIEVNGNSIKAKKSGVAFVMLRYTARLSDAEGDTYDIYTRPVRIQVGEDSVFRTGV